jgi:hypothetical protein
LLGNGTYVLGQVRVNVHRPMHRDGVCTARWLLVRNPPGDLELRTNYGRVMASRLEEDCERIDGGDAFCWAVGAVSIHSMRFVSFAALKSILLISGLVAESAVARGLAVVALLVAFIAEELSEDRFVVAASDTEIVVFDAAPGFPRTRPTAVFQRVTSESVELRSKGVLGDRWRIHGQDLRIGRTHRSMIDQWASEQPGLSVASR